MVELFANSGDPDQTLLEFFFFGKTTCELDIVLTWTVKILTTNELVKLTML